MDADLDRARAVKRKYEKRWMSLEGVVGVGIGQTSGGVGIVVSVARRTEQQANRMPSEINGVPIEIRETGEFRAFRDA
jgi:hypothetical protein